MDTVRVVCGIIFKEDTILLCRKKAEKSLGGYWEFPGGKVEPDESERDALVRELYEELSIEVEIHEYFKTSIHTYDHIEIELIAYCCKFIKSDLILIDHDAFQWVAKTELLSFNLAPADIPIAACLSAPKN